MMTGRLGDVKFGDVQTRQERRKHEKSQEI